MTKKNLFVTMFCIALVQIACYYLAGMTASADGTLPIAQPDVLLYCQAARRITEGAAFSFSEGSAICTGTTSVIHPFILAIPYALGAKGQSLITAGFVMNGFFYLIYLLGWGTALWRWLEGTVERTIAILLLALSCQGAYCAMAQSDIGLWLAISGLLASAFANDKRWMYAVLLILSPWVRPEGMVCAIAFAMIVAARRGGLKDSLIAIAAIASMLGVFALNYAMTGAAQFSSVALKGHFKTMPFPLAILQSCGDLAYIFKTYVLGFSRTILRDLLQMPIFSGLAIITAVFFYPWAKKENKNLPILILAAMGAVLTVANSGWQETNFDRYLSWMSPLLILFVAKGCAVISEKLPQGINRHLPGALVIAFAAGSSIASYFVFSRASFCSDLIRQFGEQVERSIPKGASVGSFQHSGMAYTFSPRRFAHTSGIYSPEFLTRLYMPGIISILKNEPDTRFDYWLDDVTKMNEMFGRNNVGDVSRQILSGPEGCQLGRAKWDVFDAASKTYCNDVKGMTLTDRIDVAYEKDEKRSGYEAIDRYGREPFMPFSKIDNLGNVKIIDSGRVLAGGDSFNVNLRTNAEATVVMRTLPRQNVMSYSMSVRADEFEFDNPLKMRLMVDGIDAGIVSLSYATNGFSDVSFRIPAEAIKKTPARVSLLGDHIACGYWFYQR